jgi:hypothetical protein
MGESDVMWEWAEERHPLSDEHGYAADDEAVNELRAQELPSPEGEASGGAPPRRSNDEG